jgi:multidrug efflux pump subunit AcrB
MRKRSSSILAAGMMFPVLAGIVACNFKSQHSGANAAEIPSANVAAAMRGDIAHTLSLAGQFQPYQVVDVHPKVTGFMVKINVDIGDRVRKGETLAVLEVPELNAQLKGTVFEMQRAKDDLLRAQNEIKRDEAIHSALHADYERLLETSKAQPGLIGVVNQGLPAPIDIQVSSMDMDGAYALAKTLAQKIKAMPNVSGVYIPQDLDYPGIALNIDREKASLIGLSAKDIVDNVITAMTSDGMIAPSYWIDPKSGNNYMVTVQYASQFLNNMSMKDFENIPLRGVQPVGYSPMQDAQKAGEQSRELSRGDHAAGYTPLSSVTDIKLINTPTEVDHYQIRRVIDIYVSTRTEALQGVGGNIKKLLANTKTDRNTVLNLRGAVISMNGSFAEFGVGLIIAVLMVYLILMTQFTSFIDPFIILMAIPPGLAGVVLILLVTGSTLNIMSLMGVIMMTGIVVSNSILIVEFAGTLHQQGLSLLEAVVQSCKIRLRPILMTSLATLLGMMPMALGIEPGSEQYAPLARAVIGGLAVSVVVTVFLVPAVYLIVHGRHDKKSAVAGEV